VGGIQGVTKAATEWVVPFLGLFGAGKGNGLSSFASDVEALAELGELIRPFFRPTKRDLRGQVDLGPS
jgi:hypothetical protein